MIVDAKEVVSQSGKPDSFKANLDSWNLDVRLIIKPKYGRETVFEEDQLPKEFLSEVSRYSFSEGHEVLIEVVHSEKEYPSCGDGCCHDYEYYIKSPITLIK